MRGAAPARIALIVAAARNGVIGRDGDLPWRLSSDLKLFRRLTMNKPLIMGRKTFASLKRPLEGRDSIVLTRDRAFTAMGAIVVHSMHDAIERGRVYAAARGSDEIMVIGGAEVFREALPLAKRIYLTEVDASVEGDVRFPPADWREWRKLSSESYARGPKDAFSFTFSVLDRV